MSKTRKIAFIGLSLLLMVLLGVYAYASWFFAGVLIDSATQSLTQAAETSTTPAEVGLPAPADVAIQNGEISLRGWYFDNQLDGQCGAVLLHGYTGTRYGVLHYAPLFWGRGCDLLMYDARGHGGSNGRFHTFGYYEKEDARAAAQWLAAQTGLPMSQIGLLGISYGAGTALQAAPLLPDVAFIIADSPYQDLETVMRYQAEQQYGPAIRFVIPGAWLAAELRADFQVDAVSAVDGVTQAQMPILLIHSAADTYTPPANSEAIFARADPSRTVLYLTKWGSAHGQDITKNYPGFAQLVNEFLQTYAPGFGLD